MIRRFWKVHVKLPQRHKHNANVSQELCSAYRKPRTFAKHFTIHTLLPSSRWYNTCCTWNITGTWWQPCWASSCPPLPMGPISKLLSPGCSQRCSPRTGGKHPALSKGVALRNLPTSPPQSHPATRRSFADAAVLVFASVPRPLWAQPAWEEEGGCRPSGCDSLAGTHST